MDGSKSRVVHYNYEKVNPLPLFLASDESNEAVYWSHSDQNNIWIKTVPMLNLYDYIAGFTLVSSLHLLARDKR